jgi:hypothetical protein
VGSPPFSFVWFGVQSALSSGEGFNFTRFARLLLVIALCFAMITHFSITTISQAFVEFRLSGSRGRIHLMQHQGVR